MALYGAMGKVLMVDLTAGEVTVETPAAEIYEQYLGGYGWGAYGLFQRQKPGVDPLGPENLLGFCTGVLTDTPALTGNRYQVVGKSPKTGTWGDANSGGYFGPRLKRAGVDAVFFSGCAAEPVCLIIEDGEARLQPADGLWGVRLDADTEVAEYLAAMGWDETGKPKKETLEKLGLDFVAAELYPG